MAELQAFIAEILAAGVHRIILSGPTSTDGAYKKVTLTAYDAGFRCEKLTSKQAFHSAIQAEDAPAEVAALFGDFTQINAWNDTHEFSLRRTKKGKLLAGKRAAAGAPKKAEGHNRDKQYILPEKQVVPALVDMGVMTPSGDIVKAMYDKYRQINRYLEIIDDVIRDQNLETLSIIDFGCGKSYLTFIVYYYFTELHGIPVRMTGVDLKEDVIEFCNRLAAKYGYDGLSFVHGDIAEYQAQDAVDMVISLHACDTATDYALYNAMRWKAKYIFAVPCCQHEVASQISFDQLPVFTEYGLAKERIAALLTDTLRAQLLTACGYRTQLMEFVDLCHTPKNILIRAQGAALSPSTKQHAAQTIEDTCRMFSIDPMLRKLAIDGGLYTP